MKSIRTKIILINCLICICSILSATIINYKILYENIEIQTYAKLEEISKKHAVEIENWFSLQASILNELYTEITYRNDFNKENLIKYLDYKNKNNPNIKEYYIAFPDNVFVRGCGIWIPDKDYITVEREWYKKALETNGIGISSPYIDANHGEVIITFSKAINIRDQIIGVLASDIAIDHIVNIIGESKPSEEGYVFLVDNNENVLAHPNKDLLYSKEKGLIAMSQIYNNEVEVKYLGKKELKCFMDNDGEKKFLLYKDLGFTGWSIGIAVPVKEVMQPLDRMVNSSITLAVILTFISIVLTFILGNSISKPIIIATNNIERMAKLDITQDVQEEYINSKDEIGRMFNAFQKIVKSLRRFLAELNIISEKISIFSDELATLSNQSSLDIDNIEQSLASATELKDGYVKKISKHIESISKIQNEANGLISDNHTGKEDITIESIIEDIDNLFKELNKIKEIGCFEVVQLKNIYLLIEKQTLIMEEISSASQCLAELGDELNIYISKFKS